MDLLMVNNSQVPVMLEIGTKRVFASALDWPGWCRSGRDEQAALEALLAWGPRYEQAIHSAGVGFHAPAALAALVVVERLPGDATTDFGAPNISAEAEQAPLDDATLHHLQAIFQACWETLEKTAKSAIGKELRKGPRGGGRELEKILGHVVDAHASYLRRIGGQTPSKRGDDPWQALNQAKTATTAALAAVAAGDVPAQGPRGGARWLPRYFARRAAWHILDHVWEIEERMQE
jgi:hypothetical protein